MQKGACEGLRLVQRFSRAPLTAAAWVRFTVRPVCPACVCEFFSVQNLQCGGFLRVLRFPPLPRLNAASHGLSMLTTKGLLETIAQRFSPRTDWRTRSLIRTGTFTFVGEPHQRSYAGGACRCHKEPWCSTALYWKDYLLEGELPCKPERVRSKVTFEF